ncbi:hypothetical protein BDQ17DRAFT_1370741 [Cyathus striatus]|nr:hypothetical protein BDQ17DRAFT_1370741 [Cyathus striatus]
MGFGCLLFLKIRIFLLAPFSVPHCPAITSQHERKGAPDTLPRASNACASQGSRLKTIATIQVGECSGVEDIGFDV